MTRLLLILATTTAVATPAVDEGFEARAVGERCGWNDHSTIRGDSFAGVTGATASPFAGGVHAYVFRRAADQTNGWALLDVPALTGGPVVWRVDFMVPADGAGYVDLHVAGGATYTGLRLSPGTGIAVPVSRREDRKLLDLEPHTWYRADFRIPAAGAATYDLRLCRHRPGVEPEERVFTGLPAVQSGTAFGRLKIQAPTGCSFYIDNLLLALESDVRISDTCSQPVHRKDPSQ